MSLVKLIHLNAAPENPEVSINQRSKYIPTVYVTTESIHKPLASVPLIGFDDAVTQVLIMSEHSENAGVTILLAHLNASLLFLDVLRPWLGQSLAKRLQAPPHASWSPDDEKLLLQYLIEHKSEAGDGMSFKKPTFTGAAEKVNEIITKGGRKTPDSCKNKYRSLKMTYELVSAIRGNSGWSWDDEKGVEVSPEKLGTWEAFVEKNPGAEEFAHAGWVHLEAFDQLSPSTARGVHVYRATQGPSSQDDDDQTQERETQPEELEKSGSDEESDSTPPPITPAPLVRKRSAATTSTSLKRPRDSFGSKKSGLEATPRRKQKAIIRAQRLETGWLSDKEMVSFIGLLERDIAAVDSYEVLENDSLRKEWIRRKLEKEDDRDLF
ncbi:hypothetical protein H0H93_012870 [Arthromyces matolae]|nr:hypothetical protein H0H93_012870 [Arthromyces matolae]